MYLFVAYRMLKFYTVGLKRYAAVGVGASVATFEVTPYRASDCRQLYTYLMFAPRFEVHFYQMISVGMTDYLIAERGFFCSRFGRERGI